LHLPSRLTLIGLVLGGSLLVAIAAGAGRVGVAAICAVSGAGFGLNMWRLRDALLDELQSRQVVAARRRGLITVLLGAVGFLLVIVAIVVFFTSEPGVS
jgi:hypothetical protein